MDTCNCWWVLPCCLAHASSTSACDTWCYTLEDNNTAGLVSPHTPPAAASGHYTITWTLKNGGWPRYIGTNLAGLYRQVFGITDLKGLQHDFKFIPAKPLKEQAAPDATAAATNDQTTLRCVRECFITYSQQPQASTALILKTASIVLASSKAYMYTTASMLA